MINFINENIETSPLNVNPIQETEAPLRDKAFVVGNLQQAFEPDFFEEIYRSPTVELPKNNLNVINNDTSTEEIYETLRSIEYILSPSELAIISTLLHSREKIPFSLLIDFAKKNNDINSFTKDNITKLINAFSKHDSNWEKIGNNDEFWKELYETSFNGPKIFPDRSWEENYEISHDTVKFENESQKHSISTKGPNYGNEILFKLINKYPKTSTLILIGQSISSDQLVSILNKCKNTLKNLEITNCGYISYKDDYGGAYQAINKSSVEAIGKCEHLENLALTIERFESNIGYIEAASIIKDHCPNLESGRFYLHDSDWPSKIYDLKL